MQRIGAILQVFSLIAEGNALMFSGMVCNVAPLPNIEVSGHYIHAGI